MAGPYYGPIGPVGDPNWTLSDYQALFRELGWDNYDSNPESVQIWAGKVAVDIIRHQVATGVDMTDTLEYLLSQAPGLVMSDEDRMGYAMAMGLMGLAAGEKINGGYQPGAHSRVILAHSRQIQAKFQKHAADFGVKGNYNKQNGRAFYNALQEHANHPGTQVIQGTYRGNSVIIYVNPQTGRIVLASPNNTFISGWKGSPQQIQWAVKGKLGGG